MKDMTKHDLFVCTTYDGKDLTSVLEIYFYNEDGVRVVHKTATDLCVGVNTCSDMGEELFEVLKVKIMGVLNQAEIPYGEIFEEE
jgi:hypothetical protein